MTKRMMSRKAIALTTVAAVAAIAIPVAANHGAMQLRGQWNAPQHIIPAGQTVPSQHLYAQAPQTTCSAYQPCYAQHAQLRTALSQSVNHYATQQQGQPIYLSGGPNYSGLRSAGLPIAPTIARGPNVMSIDMSMLRNRSVASDYISPSYDLGGMSVRTSAAHTNRMLDWQENTTGKALTLLQHRRNGVLAPNSLYLGAGVKGGFMYQKTDSPGQFPVLSRFPNFSPGTDTESGVFAINNAALAITGTFGDWTTIYLQPEYSETSYNSSQDEMQLRKAFVTFGNLDKAPVYAAFGRKTIDFGNFDSYNPFLHTEAQHYFWAQSDQPVLELGYYKNGLKASVSAFSGGRQLRTAYAGEENNIANYAASLEKEFLFGRDSAFTVGASYLHDSIYRNNWTAHTFADINTGTPPANLIEYRNSIGSAFAEYNSSFFDAMLEYTSTFEPWAAVIPQNIAGVVDPAYLNTDGSINFDENLSVTVAQMRIKPVIAGKVTPISLVGSWGNISDENYTGTGTITGLPTSFGKNQQHVLGIERAISPYLDFGAEYVYNKGFIPFVAPQEVSNQDTEAHAVHIGFKARF